METGELELERALAGDVANTGVDEVNSFAVIFTYNNGMNILCYLL